MLRLRREKVALAQAVYILFTQSMYYIFTYEKDFYDFSGLKFMEINISQVLKNKSEALSFTINKDDFHGDDYEVEIPLQVSLTMKTLDDIVLLNGNVSGTLKLTCCRCLEKFDYPINLDINEKLSNNYENKDEDIIFINNDKIDITEIIENNIRVGLPIKILCKEDCKGLCQYCGTNLNYSTCSCNNDDIDPRMAKLKELFSND